MPSSRHRFAEAFIAASMLMLVACAAEDATAPTEAIALSRTETNPLADEVRRLAAERGIIPLERPAPVRPALVRLGRLLAFDRELSGNRDIACMTCHLPRFGTGDGRSLSIGQGAAGLGPDRSHPVAAFIPRNAPSAFNLSALESFFWDGRVSRDATGIVHTPAGDRITPGMAAVFEFGALSALPMFPVLSREEMRGADGNELAVIPDDDPAAAWAALMRRLGVFPEYRHLFEAAYPGQRFADMTFAHASNAIAGFLVSELAFNDSPWDRFLAGNDAALTEVQLAGANNFMSARCSICHNGPAFTDNQFHNVAVAQLGPGQGDGLGGRDDFGRMRVTGLESDRYRFRTTPLRNVELTGPWGHDGAFTDLRAFVDHYSESHLKLQGFDATQLEPLLRGSILPNIDAILATRDPLLDGVVFTPQQVDEVTEFMRALTDPAARNLGRITPQRVPSGLPVDDTHRAPIVRPGVH
ncbi:MAG TPA: cytochrome c peroxidase [Gemmatimonadales bacterium]|nr:cytochrome c peroxidase [Gemmatimonadales bacterium]